MMNLATGGTVIIPVYEGTRESIGYWILKSIAVAIEKGHLAGAIALG